VQLIVEFRSPEPQPNSIVQSTTEAAQALSIFREAFEVTASLFCLHLSAVAMESNLPNRIANSQFSRPQMDTLF